MYQIAVEALPVTAAEINTWLKKNDPLFTGTIPGTQPALDRTSRQIEELLKSKNLTGQVAGKIVSIAPQRFVHGDDLIGQEGAVVGAVVAKTGDGAGKTRNSKSVANRPKVLFDVTGAPRLGSWEPGPAPPWFDVQPYSMQTSHVLPGCIRRSAADPGRDVRRNVDTIWPRGSISTVCWSPDGLWIAMCSADGHVRIYAAETMQFVQLLPGAAFQCGALNLAWHPDSERLAVTADSMNALRIWSRTGTLLFEETGGDASHSVAWSHDGKYLAQANQSRLVLRNSDGTVAKVLCDGESLGVGIGNGLAWDPRHLRLACSHVDGKVRIWDVEPGNSTVLRNCPRSARIAWPGVRTTGSPWPMASTCLCMAPTGSYLIRCRSTATRRSGIRGRTSSSSRTGSSLTFGTVIGRRPCCRRVSTWWAWGRSPQPSRVRPMDDA